MPDTATNTRTVNPIPEGFRTVTPSLIVDDAAAAIDFYVRAFDAQELGRFPAPDGKIMHAELQIGDSRFMLNDEFPEMGCNRSPRTLGSSTASIHLYVPDADAVFERAVAAGATVTMPLMDAFWGDRYGRLTDPFGHDWAIATHQEDLSPEEMERRGAEAFAAGPA